jgi:hypothetical protein
MVNKMFDNAAGMTMETRWEIEIQAPDFRNRGEIPT